MEDGGMEIEEALRTPPEGWLEEPMDLDLREEEPSTIKEVDRKYGRRMKWLEEQKRAFLSAFHKKILRTLGESDPAPDDFLKELMSKAEDHRRAIEEKNDSMPLTPEEEAILALRQKELEIKDDYEREKGDILKESVRRENR